MMVCEMKRLGPGDDLEMLNSPGLWPRWPVLPVKRWVKEKNDLKLGVVIDQEGPRSTVIECNLIMVMLGFDLADPTLVRHVYWNHEAMLADGWVVD